MKVDGRMGTNKLWLLVIAALLAGMVSAWMVPTHIRDRFTYVIALITAGCFIFSVGFRLLASRSARKDVTTVEMLARRVFFKAPD